MKVSKRLQAPVIRKQARRARCEKIVEEVRIMEVDFR